MPQARQQTEDRAAEIAAGGLTLRERLQLRRDGKERFGKIDNHFTARAKIWRSWFDATGDRDAWAEFLAEEDLSETKLICLDSLAGPKRKLPAWQATLGRICNYLQHTGSRSDSRLSVCENLASPLVSFAWDELAACTNRSHLRLLSAKAALKLRRSLRQRLARTADQAAQWEISAAAAGQRLSMNLAPSGRSKFHDYFFSSGLATEALRFLQNYPALARLWTVQLESWLRFVDEFLRDANAFGCRLDGKIDNCAPMISSIEPDLSDPHEGNRTVMRVRFGEHREWFYKPRHGLHERAWFELLGWINTRGFPRPFRILSVACEDRHCWMESARPRQCRNRKEAADFCFRFGALACLIHVLRGVDIHPANIVASGDQPVVVDCETLLHPVTALPEYARDEDASIARTGMLMVLRVPEFVSSKSENVLMQITEGFRAMHDFLRHRATSAYLQKWRNRLQKIPGRNVYRPTAHYYETLKGSLVPSLLTSGLERSLYLRARCREDCTSPRRIHSEVRALENADIPVFRRKQRRIKIDLSERTLEDSLSTMRAKVTAIARS
jgi:lantibiotic modifying enzyme